MEEALMMKAKRYPIRIFVLTSLGLLVVSLVCVGVFCYRAYAYTARLYWSIAGFMPVSTLEAIRSGIFQFRIWSFDPLCMALLILSALCLAVMIVFLIIALVHSKVELIITEKHAFGRVIFGKQVDLPIDSISAVGTGWMKSITISTASGKIAFSLIKNRDEVLETITELLNKRQRSGVQERPAEPETARGESLSTLKELKELMDSGVITQEEFEKKKAQILGL